MLRFLIDTDSVSAEIDVNLPDSSPVGGTVDREAEGPVLAVRGLMLGGPLRTACEGTEDDLGKGGSSAVIHHVASDSNGAIIPGEAAFDITKIFIIGPEVGLRIASSVRDEVSSWGHYRGSHLAGFEPRVGSTYPHQLSFRHQK